MLRLPEEEQFRSRGNRRDFVLEIASRSTGQHDVVDKRPAYVGLEIPEYCRFDETGEFHGTRLAGGRLVDGGYEPVPSRPLTSESHFAQPRARG